mmetsp:Transcript_126184/g.218604  ORF Transcript_126184/g.218604 Transcript_126184/m.218604 type:complete len:346 (-) Transcript_126184:1107-2144(-)
MLCLLALGRAKLLSLFQTLHCLIHLPELPAPASRVEELPKVKAVVLWTVVLRVVCRGQGGHLVAVDGVVEEELLHLLPDDRGAQVCPFVRQLVHHPDGPTAADLPQLAKHGEVVVGHAHVLLVGLLRATPSTPKLGCRWGLYYTLKDRVALVGCSPPQEGLQIHLADTPNRVDVCGRAIILRVVAPESLIDVGGAKDQEGSAAARSPGHELRHEVGHHHAGPGLDVLHRQVLSSGPPIIAHLRHFANHGAEGIHDGRRDAIDVDFVEIAANLQRQLPGPALCLRTGVGRGHVNAPQHLLRQLLRCAWDPVRPAGDLLHICNCGLGPFLAGLDHFLAHDPNQSGGR